MAVLGVLPMAGSGSRLGLLFPKPLSPTFTYFGIKPLFEHAFDRLEPYVDRIVAVIAEEDAPLFAAMRATRFNNGNHYFLTKPSRGTATDTIAFVAQHAIGGLVKYDTLAIALPDSVWYPKDAFEGALTQHKKTGNQITLLTMNAPASQLDHVEPDGDGWHVSEHLGPKDSWLWNGWFALVGESKKLAKWRSDKSWAENINSAKSVGAFHVPNGEYFDLGTPERYEAYIGRDKDRW